RRPSAPDRAAALRIPQLERRHGSYRCCAAELSNHRSPYPAVAGERLEEFYALPMCYSGKMGAEAEGEFVRPQRSAGLAPGPFPTASGDPPPSAAPEMCRQIRVVLDKQKECQVQVVQNLRLVRRQAIAGDFHGIRCRNDQ